MTARIGAASAAPRAFAPRRPGSRARGATSGALASLAGLALAVGAAGAPTARAEPEHRIRIGTIAPEGTPWADHLEQIKERIEQDSGGRIKVVLYLAGRKGDEARLITLLRQGKIQAAAVSNGAIAAEVKELQVLELPYLFENDGEADYVIDEVIGRELEARAIAHGLLINVWSDNGWRSIGTKRTPVRRLEDIAGLKVRAQETPTNLAFWHALGPTTVPIPLDEVLVALQSDVIDGFDQTPIYMAAGGWHTQIQHFTLTRHTYQPAVLVYNKRFIDDLGPDLARIVLGDARAESRRSRELVRKENDKILRALTQQRIEVLELSPAELARLRERVRSVWSTLRDEIGGELIDKVSAAVEEHRRKAQGAGAPPAPPSGDEPAPDDRRGSATPPRR